jgi:hypothetical protein
MKVRSSLLAVILVVLLGVHMTAPVNVAVHSGIGITSILEAIVGACVPDHVATSTSVADLVKIRLDNTTVKTREERSTRD